MANKQKIQGMLDNAVVINIVLYAIASSFFPKLGQKSMFLSARKF